jgi:hypothetical protein
MTDTSSFGENLSPLHNYKMQLLPRKSAQTRKTSLQKYTVGITLEILRIPHPHSNSHYTLTKCATGRSQRRIATTAAKLAEGEKIVQITRTTAKTKTCTRKIPGRVVLSFKRYTLPYLVINIQIPKSSK